MDPTPPTLTIIFGLLSLLGFSGLIKTIVTVVLFVLSLVGLGGLIALRRFVSRWFANHRLLRFHPSGDLDIILSAYEPPEAMPRDRRNTPHTLDSQLVAFGYTKTVSVLARVAGESGYRKALNLRIAEVREGSLPGDLVLIGGTRGHDIAFDYLQYLREAYPALKIHFNDECESNNYILLKRERPFTYNWLAEASSGPPKYDVALIVLWLNPYSSSKRRSILCAGCTSYGTVAATDFVVGDGLRSFWKANRRTFLDVARGRNRNGFPWTPLRWPHVAMTLQFSVPEGDAEVLIHEVLKDDRSETRDRAHVALETRDEERLSANERRSIGAMLARGFSGLGQAQAARGWIQVEPVFRVLAMRGGTIIGQIAVVDLEAEAVEGKRDLWNGRCMGIADLTVEENFRGKGIGRFLIESAIAESRKRDVNVLMVASGPEVGIRHIFELQCFEDAGDRFFVKQSDGSDYRNPAWMVRVTSSVPGLPTRIRIKSDF